MSLMSRRVVLATALGLSVVISLAGVVQAQSLSKPPNNIDAGGLVGEAAD